MGIVEELFEEGSAMLAERFVDSRLINFSDLVQIVWEDYAYYGLPTHFEKQVLNNAFNFVSYSDIKPFVSELEGSIVVWLL